MSLSSIEFVLQETAANIYRNRLQMLAAISTVAVTLMILGSFVFSIANLTRVAGNLPSQFEITVHLKDNVTRDQRFELRKKLTALPGVTSITFRSKDEVYKQLKRWLGSSVDLSGIEKNPQTDEYRVRIEDIAETKQVVGAITKLQRGGQSRIIDEVVAAPEAAKKLAHLIGFLRLFGTVVTLLLVGATALIVSNALRLTIHARRREIRIMQLVGATNWFIRGPYVLEGMFHGLIGAAIACLVVQIGGSYLCGTIQRLVPFMGVWETSGGILAMLIALGVLLGAAGSFISIRRFLKV